MKTKRDEFSCPCCGTPTDGWYCVECQAFDCGEQSAGVDNCLVPKGVSVALERHAAHYMGQPGKGHDLFFFTFQAPSKDRPAGLPLDAEYLQGFVANGEQWWQYVKKAPFSPGRCRRCP